MKKWHPFGERASFSSVSLKDLMALTFPLGNLKEKCHVPTLDSSLRAPCHQKPPSAAVCSQHPHPTTHKPGALQLSEHSWATATDVPCWDVCRVRARAEHRAATTAAAPHHPQIPALYSWLLTAGPSAVPGLGRVAVPCQSELFAYRNTVKAALRSKCGYLIEGEDWGCEEERARNVATGNVKWKVHS